VGKRHLLKTLAQRIINGECRRPGVTSALLVVWTLGSLIAGAKFRGEFEERLNRRASANLASREAGNPVYPTKLHTMVAPKAEGFQWISRQHAQPALARGEHCTASAPPTLDAVPEKYIEKDARWQRRFQESATVEEPSKRHHPLFCVA